MEHGNAGVCRRRQTGVPGEKPSEQGREPTTNSAHIQHWDREPTWATLVGGESLTTAPSLLSNHCWGITTVDSLLSELINNSKFFYFH